jgi:hypothetical protein
MPQVAMGLQLLSALQHDGLKLSSQVASSWRCPPKTVPNHCLALCCPQLSPQVALKPPALNNRNFLTKYL